VKAAVDGRNASVSTSTKIAQSKKPRRTRLF
jgi:hypothetical protein